MSSDSGSFVSGAMVVFLSAQSSSSFFAAGRSAPRYRFVHVSLYHKNTTMAADQRRHEAEDDFMEFQAYLMLSKEG